MPRVHFAAPSPVHALVALRGTMRVLLDSDRTEDILDVEEILAQAQLEHLVQHGVLSNLRDKPELLDVDMDEMAALPEDTLGFALARFYETYGLTTKLYSAPASRTPNPEAAYMMRRVWQSHDVWHVLMNFTVRGHDEVLIHAFSLAQTGFPGSMLLVLLGSIKHMVLEARWRCLRRAVFEAYRRGRAAAPLLGIRWEEHLGDKLEDVRAQYRIEPWTEGDHAGTAPWVW